MKYWDKDVILDIIGMREKGISFVDIAKKYDSSRQLCTAIYHRHKERYIQPKESEFLNYNIHGTPFINP